MRARVADELPLSPGMHILDVATGYGYFAAEVAQRCASAWVVGIDILPGDVERSIGTHAERGVSGRVDVIQMDATRMAFRDGVFDMVVNFLGFEDVHMTRGSEGVQRAFGEVSRVLKPGGHFCSVLMPPDEMENDAERTEVALYAYICDATSLPMGCYENLLGRAGFRILRRKAFYTRKKLTPDQAKTEIRFAVEHVPRLFGRRTPTYEDIWARFGRAIERHGVGQCSKTVLVISRKV